MALKIIAYTIQDPESTDPEETVERYVETWDTEKGEFTETADNMSAQEFEDTTEAQAISDCKDAVELAKGTNSHPTTQPTPRPH